MSTYSPTQIFWASLGGTSMPPGVIAGVLVMISGATGVPAAMTGCVATAGVPESAGRLAMLWGACGMPADRVPDGGLVLVGANTGGFPAVNRGTLAMAAGGGIIPAPVAAGTMGAPVAVAVPVAAGSGAIVVAIAGGPLVPGRLAKGCRAV